MTAAPQDGPLPARLSFQEVSELNARFEDASAETLLAWALEQFGERLVIASSFGVEDVVLIDHAVRVSRSVRVFTLDTGRLHQATYETLEQVRRHFGVEVEVYFPDHDAVERLVGQKGPNSFYESIENRKECCRIRKVEPLRRALSTADAWATGMRREQSTARQRLAKVEIDMLNGGLVKLNPLAAWTRDEVWDWVRRHDLPYNRLHDEGFASIGCAPCTRAVNAGEPERAGRWWWERTNDKECGLHAR